MPALRIALDIGPLHGHRTGVGVAVDGIVRALGEREDVDLMPYLVSFRARPDAGQRRLPLPGIVASHVWARWDRPSAGRWLAGATLVHGTNYVAPPSELPTVVSVYDCWFLEHPRDATPVVRRAGDWLRRAVARGAWVHTSSEATSHKARRLLATDRVVTIHLGPPPTPPALAELPRPAVASTLAGRPFVLAIGTEERRKGLPHLVDAFGQLTGELPDAVLVLAGAPGDDSDQVVAAIGRLGAATRERVVRLGPVDESTKHWLLRQATALAYPSLDEGFGFPIVEAQSAGTPVVARRVGAVAEIAGDGALLVDDGGTAALAEALGQVLTSGAARIGLVAAGYDNVHRFTWSATAAGLVDLYRRVLDAGERR